MHRVTNQQIEDEALRQLNAEVEFTLKVTQDAQDIFNVTGSLMTANGERMLYVQVPGIMAAMCGVESAVKSSINAALAA